MMGECRWRRPLRGKHVLLCQSAMHHDECPASSGELQQVDARPVPSQHVDETTFPEALHAPGDHHFRHAWEAMNMKLVLREHAHQGDEDEGSNITARETKAMPRIMGGTPVPGPPVCHGTRRDDRQLLG